MSDYIARELKDIELNIVDECGAIINVEKQYDYQDDKLDPMVECGVAHGGVTWRNLWTHYTIKVKPGFKVEADWVWRHVESDSFHLGSEIVRDYPTHYSDYRCDNCGIISDISFQQSSQYRIFYGCVDGNPVVDHSLDSYYYNIISTDVVDVVVTPLFSGSGVLVAGGVVLIDDSGNVIVV